MYRPALRTALRPALRTRIPIRHYTSSSPADKPRSWKSTAVRWGLAGAALYYFTNSTLFAEEVAPRTVDAPAVFNEVDLKTVEDVLEEKRKIARAEQLKQAEENAKAEQLKNEKIKQTKTEQPTTQGPTDTPTGETTEGGIGALQEEADQQGAFNPETGEINWDCPCLGGMAHGPCGEEFKTAFSCFVHSTEEPKGMDCIEKFQGMQECFREYPEIYGAELSDEDTPEMDEPAKKNEEEASAKKLGDAAVKEEKAAVKEVPAKETPAKETPAKETPAKETPAKETPAKETPAKETSAKETYVVDDKMNAMHEDVPDKWDDARGANETALKEEAKSTEKKE